MSVRYRNNWHKPLEKLLFLSFIALQTVFASENENKFQKRPEYEHESAPIRRGILPMLTPRFGRFGICDCVFAEK